MSQFSFFFSFVMLLLLLPRNNVLELMKRILKTHFIDRYFSMNMLRNVRRQICEAITMQYDTKLASTTQF